MYVAWLLLCILCCAGVFCACCVFVVGRCLWFGCAVFVASCLVWYLLFGVQCCLLLAVSCLLIVCSLCVVCCVDWCLLVVDG